MPRAFICDFDGTVSPSDIGAAFARRFSPGGTAETPEFLARWQRDEMGHRELTVAQCALLAVTREEAMTFTRDFTIDPHFAPFVGEALARGDVVTVASEGFDFYVRDQLERAGLGTLPWTANGLRFAEGRVVPEFPEVADGCGRCGNCKGRHVRAWRARGYRTVVVGDGLSDRCGAREADEVHARRDLLDWCRGEGIAATPFENFADVAKHVLAQRDQELSERPGRGGETPQTAEPGWRSGRGRASASPGWRSPAVSPPRPGRSGGS